MIDQVDIALENRLRVLFPDPAVVIDFEPPTVPSNHASIGPTTVGVHLYDVREALDRAQNGTVVYRQTETGPSRVTAEHDPPRYGQLSYLLTTRAAATRDAHRMLGLAFAGLAKSRELEVALSDQLATLTAQLEVGRPVAENRATSELWTALGNTLTPFLNATVIVPILTFESADVAHIVLHDPEVRNVDLPPWQWAPTQQDAR